MQSRSSDPSSRNRAGDHLHLLFSCDGRLFGRDALFAGVLVYHQAMT